jgi:hypothetical protein
MLADYRLRWGTSKRKLEVVVKRDRQNDEQRSSFLTTYASFLIGNSARMHTEQARDTEEASLKQLHNMKTENL